MNYWITSYKRNFTCGFTTDKKGYILRNGTAPILSKFVGQHINRLLLWAGNNRLVRQ